MRSTATVVLALIAGCSDYELNTNKDDVNEPISDTEFIEVTDSEDTEPPPDPEECDGIDNDEDGAVDEDFNDQDGDGVADCLDDECDLDAYTPEEVEIDTGCEGDDIEITDDPWDVTTEWHWGSTSDGSYSAGMIANLQDTDGDGDIDEDDIPNVVVSTNSGALVLLEGDSGTVVWSKANAAGAGTNPAIGDLDGDGVADIVSFSSRRPAAYDHDGNTLWTASTTSSESYPLAQIADVDADGNPEVIAGNLLLNGQTGALIATLSSTGYIPYTSTSIGDLDQDGQAEIVYGNTVYDSSGTKLWAGNVTGSYGHWSAIINADGDTDGEVVMVGSSKLEVYDPDGTTLYSSTVGQNAASPICAADFDGDGEVEVSWASYGTFWVTDLDGTALWSSRIDDSSGLAGCSGYDVNGDGTYEIMYADQGTFYIFDGPTGATLYSDTNHYSGTVFEYPTVADVDNDGSAEIVYSHSGSPYGVTALGHNGDGWAKSGSIWPVHDFAVNNISSDGTVPSTPPDYWNEYNVFRARPIVDELATDLDIFIDDVCFAGCLDVSTVAVSVVIENVGGVEVDAGVDVALYGLDGSTETLIMVESTADAIASGMTSEALVFEFGRTEWGVDGILVRVDDDGTGTGSVVECYEDNNEDTYLDDPC